MEDDGVAFAQTLLDLVALFGGWNVAMSYASKQAPVATATTQELVPVRAS